MSEQSTPVDPSTQDGAKNGLLRLSDADVIFMYTVALIASGAYQRLAPAFAEGIFVGISSIFNVNAAQILVPATIWFVLKSCSKPVQLNRIDHIVTIFSAIWFVFPEPRLSYIGATILGLNLWLKRADDARLVSAGQILLALSTCELWGHILFKTIAAPLIEWEAACVAWVGSLLGLGLRREGVVIVSGAKNWAILIMDGCSSYHNVALAPIIWFCLIKLDGSQITPRTVKALASGVALIIFLNVLRLLAMTESVENYEFWHHGAGSLVFSSCALFAIIVPTLVTMLWSQR